METATAVEIDKGRLRQYLLDDSHKLFGKAFAKTSSGFTTVPTAPPAVHSFSEEAITNKPPNTKFKFSRTSVVPDLASQPVSRRSGYRDPSPTSALPCRRCFQSCRKVAQRRAIGGVAIHHFVRQRKTIGRDHQRDHELQAVGPPISTVSAFGFRIVFHLTLKVSARQIVEQHFKVGVKQIRPLLSEPHEQILLVFQQTV